MPFTQNHMRALFNTTELYLLGGVNFVKPYSKPWWFAYMWREARTAWEAFNLQHAALLPFFNALYLLPPEWAAYAGGALVPGLAGPLRARTTWETVDNAVFTAAMAALYGLAFDGQAVQNVPGGGLLVWRGDSRSYEQITAAGGLNNKANTDQNNFAASLNLRAAWNPLADLLNRQNFLIRRAQVDNCTETTVSVATTIQVGCLFPRLFDVTMRPADGTPLPVANVNPGAATLFSRVEVTSESYMVGPFFIGRFVDRVQLYYAALPAASNYFDTQAYQANIAAGQEFPEYGVKDIPAPNIVGSVMARRVWHSLDEKDGFTIVIDDEESLAPQPPTTAQVEERENNPIVRALVETLLARQTAYAQATAAANNQSYHWTATGAVEVDPLAVAGPGELAPSAVTAILGIKNWP